MLSEKDADIEFVRVLVKEKIVAEKLLKENEFVTNLENEEVSEERFDSESEAVRDLVKLKS